MKANKIEIHPKAVHRVLTKVLDANGDNTYETVEEAAQVRIRYVQPDGKYHRMGIPADVAEIVHFTDLTANEIELVKACCTQAAALSENTNVQEMHFFCGCERADVKINETTGQPEIVGIAPEKAFTTVAIKYKDHKGAYQVKADKDYSGTLPEVKSFCDAVFAHKAGIYAEVYRLMQLKDEPDVQATKTVEVEEEVVEILNGKSVHTTKTVKKEQPLFDELPCVDVNGDLICDEHGDPIAPHKVPRRVTGYKVSDADNARLAELLGRL